MQNGNRVAALVLGSLVALLTHAAQAQNPADDGARFFHDPDIVGKHIAFLFGQDLWLAPLAGGSATRLTRDGLRKQNPRISPDGRHIAYTVFRQDNADVYVIPTTGGSPRRLTWHPGADVSRAWSRDGRNLLITSDRASYFPGGQARLFTINASGGGLPQPLPMQKGFWADYAPDGRLLAYTPILDAFATWKRYRGGQASPIWLVDLDDWSHAEIPHTRASDTNPVWLESGIYFRSDRDGVMRVYRYDESIGSVERVAGEGADDVDALAGDGRTLVYAQAGFRYVHDLDNWQSRRLTIRIDPAEMPSEKPNTINAAFLAEDLTFSPDGQRVAFEARGDVFLAKSDGSDPVNLSATPHRVERDPVWSPDGSRLAYLAELDGEYRLHSRSDAPESTGSAVAGAPVGYL